MKSSSRNKLGMALRALERLTVEDLGTIVGSDVQSVADQIRKYLGVGSADGLTANEHKLCAEGRKINAIKEVRARTGLGLADSKDLVEKFYPHTRAL